MPGLARPVCASLQPFLFPTPGCPWSPWTEWTGCSCSFLVQQRYRNQRGPGAGGEPCVGLDGQFHLCDYSQCSGEATRSLPHWWCLSFCSAAFLWISRGGCKAGKGEPFPLTPPTLLRVWASPPAIFPPESSCKAPFEFQECGSPCDHLCSTLRHPELCKDIPRCLPGCYCPQVRAVDWNCGTPCCRA